MPDFPSGAERSKAGKTALRNRLLAVRALKSTPDRLSAAESLQAVLLSLVRAQHRSTIAGYVPIGSEPGGTDLPDVLMGALPPGGRLLLPVLLNDGDLDWAAYPGTLQRGSRGLWEPVGDRLGVDAIGEASLVVVPALAVSSTGIRLGRGGGSYDRALSRVTATALTVALLYDGELVDVVPAEAHDRAVRAAITPSRGLTLSQAAP
jgi:5-formyltetrahydrofolate cyclo-ligase